MTPNQPATTGEAEHDPMTDDELARVRLQCGGDWFMFAIGVVRRLLARLDSVAADNARLRKQGELGHRVVVLAAALMYGLEKHGIGGISPTLAAAVEAYDAAKSEAEAAGEGRK
jgi:hypothetical protein